ncbi:MAG: hypothetical protein COV01_03205 [Candidatus Taylorbacteria bacterium CG10_big_fil_rev_8_21_14_0_10_41_48]|uniref:Rod shape-determining protein MreC beta-barrel core domain-containing protein n=1 Tax=Candidatus Taylorbacteria bacterium CG10_big_fil_rev_8_21_14_0_10_41_48 TaxID=1975024 RepID=A0A2M8LBS9_9BACT|nr:MAG: hypothetical protein COV01_03205 [Candidatus Taylorbacteria bacterium CG10_big_fil_rev_8_21_14_0_10_41_48]
MIYLKRSNPSARKEFKKKTGFVVFIAFLFLIHVVFPHAYGAVLYPVTSIFLKSGTFIGDTVSNYAELMSSKKSLIQENIRLRDEAVSLRPSLLILDSIRKENDTLRSLLGRHTSDNRVLAVVLSRPPFSPYDSLILDIGSTDGVFVGDKVYAATDILLGDISDVYSHTAKVNLFSSPGRKVPVLVGPSAIQVEAVGRGSGNFRAVLPSEVGIEKGDPVRFAQSKLNIVGVIEEIVVDSTDSLQEILFKMPLTLSEVSYVEVHVTSVQTTK